MRNTGRYLFLAIFPLIAFGLSASPAHALPPGSGKLYYVHNDATGTPQALTDEAGNVVWTAETDPFGGAKVNEDPDGDGQLLTFNIRSPGQYFDQETGLHYNYFRYYDPQTGRYLTSDPIGLAGGLNTYSFANGNPVNLIDPFGLAGSGRSSIDDAIRNNVLRGNVEELRLLLNLSGKHKKEQVRRLIQQCKANKKKIKEGTLDVKQAENDFYNNLKRRERAKDVGREGKAERISDFLDWMRDFLE